MITILALKIGSEGDKISKNTLSYRLTSCFLEICHPRSRLWAKIENIISPDHVLYY